MKTLREIQDEVARRFNYHWSINLQEDYKKGIISDDFYNDYLHTCFIEVQRKAQIKINKRIEDGYLNGNFDTTSVINDNNLII